MRHNAAWARSLAVAAGAVLAAGTASALDPQRFVAGWPIELPAGASVFDVPLTTEVYAAAANVGQLAVLDANGTPLSFFRRSAPPAATEEQRVTLEASPLYVAAGAGGPSVGVTTSGRGTSVTVTPGGSASPAVTAFVLDAQAVTNVPVALELDWRALTLPFLLEVRVEQSTNLTDWRPIGSAAVAALAIGDTEVRHARVPVRARAGGYYRVRANRAVDDWYLLRATLVSTTAEPVVPLTMAVASVAPELLPESADPEAFYFDVGAVLPVTAVSVRFAADNNWLRGAVAAGASLEGPWTIVAYNELFYSLALEGQQFANPPVATGRQEARYWRIVPTEEPRGGQLTLALEFPQEFLRVAANGGGAPYLLAAGTLAEEAGPDPTFASVWSEVHTAAESVPIATLGARRELGGAAVLVAPRPFPWRTTALWAVLIGGALVVVLMAVRLAREMQNKSA